MDNQTSGMVAPLIPAMTGSAAPGLAREIREPSPRHTGIVQILTGEIEIANLIGPHPLSRVQAFRLTRPTRCSGHQQGTWRHELLPSSAGSALQMLGEGSRPYTTTVHYDSV
jgi:hypothetical protein